MLEIYELQWDDENEEHVATHAIQPSEIRQVFDHPFITRRNPRRDGRVSVIGVTSGGRLLTIALDATIDPTTWRPVTAMDASPADRAIYDSSIR